MISTTSPAAAEAVRPDEGGKPGWAERGIDGNPDGKGRIRYWAPPGGCGNPADGEGLIVIQATFRAGYLPEPPYRIHVRPDARTLPGSFPSLEEAVAEAERVAIARKTRKNGGETPGLPPEVEAARPDEEAVSGEEEIRPSPVITPAPVSAEDRKEFGRLYRNAAAIHMDIAGLLAWTGRRNTADITAAERCNRLAERYDKGGV